MSRNWNRKQRRQMSRYGIGQKVLNEQYDVVRDTTREDAYRNAFAAMLLALHELRGYGYKRIKAVAVKTIQNINSTDCESQLIERLKMATGFDVEEPLEEYESGMEVE